VAVWLSTAAVSLWELGGQSRALLIQAGLSSNAVMDSVVFAGAGLDLALGLLLWLKPARWVYAAALAGMLVMTVIATLLLPSLWLHPLGPLTKNLPMAAMLWVLWRSHP